MLEFHPEALEEVDRARAWYDAQRAGLGDELLDDLEATLARVAAKQGAFPRAGSSRRARRALLHRFPYALVFRELESSILVVALAHAKRPAAYWESR